MAAEFGTIIRDAVKGSDGIRKGLSGAFDQIVDVTFEPLLKEYPTASKKRKQKILNRLSSDWYSCYASFLAVEAEIISESSPRLEMESLTTDTKGGKSLEWFDTTGLVFSTGVATSCFTFAIVNDRIGMGASHRNPYTPQVFDKAIREAAQHTDAQGLFRLDLAISHLDLETILSTVSRAVGEGMDEFAKLIRKNTSFKHVPAKGNKVLIGGLQRLANQSNEQEIFNQVQALVKRHTIFHQGLNRDVELVCNHDLGKSGGLLYGGPNHPNYPELVPYSLS